MALYAFVAALIVWVVIGFRMAFGERRLPFWGRPIPPLASPTLVHRDQLPTTTHFFCNDMMVNLMEEPLYQHASLVYFDFMFAVITLILLAGSVLGLINIKAWMTFIPLCLLVSYTVGAFSL
ncbi:hypothetical protein Cni_G27663 [Canna indica]|uniref:Ammonium transporter AmtB-like domain-containing protein n=1 Tax=Canna indica TaxID=4628 RepID=A0AAQ3L5Z7_9LILI|nr:hypothetical protein Cni_G27663 [Canna indica]